MGESLCILTLGCAKNLVDSENMAAFLAQEGYCLVQEINQARIVVVNTCGFIESAKEESIQEILRAAKYKEHGSLRYLIVTGCLVQRYSKELKRELPEVDAFLGTSNFHRIVETIHHLDQGGSTCQVLTPEALLPANMPRRLLTKSYYAYLKIAEGCDNRCTYCIIPQLRGPYRSRPQEDILEEAKNLAEKGVKELILIAQDTSKYGMDLYGEKRLPKLLQELDQISGLEWIRVLYSYPEDLDEDYIRTIGHCSKVLPYFDIPIQHASNTVLKRMNRRITKEEIRQKIALIRTRLPHAVIRTTVITGFPGETAEEFRELEDFVKEVAFDRLGAFAYSKEEGTPAAKMKGQLRREQKERRRDKIMALQQGISKQINQKLLGETLEIRIESQLEEGLYEGRSWRDMVEIDGAVLVESHKKLEIGRLTPVMITQAQEYDLIGVTADEYTQ